jgi:hypothetical protein
VLLDEGISGTTLDRPGLHRARELVQAQAIAAVIVIDPDWLSRHVGHHLLLAEVAQQEDTAGERRAARLRDIEVIEVGRATCDGEAQHWADAYAAEVIGLLELKEYRREIGTRRQQLQDRRAALHAEVEAIGQTSGQLELLISSCAHVRDRLQTFDEREKR